MTPQTDPDTDVLIAGGGMVGRSLAIALAGAGLRVALTDSAAPETQRDREFDGRASAIALSSQRMLAAAGIWEALAETAEPILEIRVSDGGAPQFLHFDHRELSDDPFGWMVENRHLRIALQDAAAQCGTLHRFEPDTIASVERDAAGVRAHLSSGTAVRARLLVAADGRRSVLRRQAGIRCLTWDYPQTAIVTTVAHERPHHGIAQERFLPAGPFAILPLPENRASIVWTERRDLAPGYLAMDEACFEAALAERFTDYLGAVRVIAPRWSYPLGLHLAERYIDTRLALVGDAAHGIHPIAGQGLNLGIRDVAALAEALVESRRLGLDIGGYQTLARYQRWRRADTLLLAAVTDSLNRLFSNDIVPIRALRDAGLAAVNRIDPLKRFFMRHARGTVGELPRLLRGEPL